MTEPPQLPTRDHPAGTRDVPQPGRRRFSNPLSIHFKIGRRRVGTAASLQNSCLEGSIPSRPANLFPFPGGPCS